VGLPVLEVQVEVVEAAVKTKGEVFRELLTREEVEGLLVIPMLEVLTIPLVQAVVV
jgi:hypothetical protein